MMVVLMMVVMMLLMQLMMMALCIGRVAGRYRTIPIRWRSRHRIVRMMQLLLVMVVVMVVGLILGVQPRLIDAGLCRGTVWQEVFLV